MKWKSLNKEDSIKQMTQLRDSDFKIKRFEDKSLRDSLWNLMDETTKELEISRRDISDAGYKVDLIYAIKLYEEFEKLGMTLRDASDIGIWRHISLKVVPDIVHLRWGDSDARFWQTPRRIWLRTLWLYIYLSWQGNSEKTYETLKHNTTDEIVQLVERAGRGYRVEFTREIMKYYGEINSKIIKNKKNMKKSSTIKEDIKTKNSRNSDIFRKVMKLNTARVQVFEPGLVEGGVEEYVRSLFKYFES